MHYGISRKLTNVLVIVCLAAHGQHLIPSVLTSHNSTRLQVDLPSGSAQSFFPLWQKYEVRGGLIKSKEWYYLTIVRVTSPFG